MRGVLNGGLVCHRPQEKKPYLVPGYTSLCYLKFACSRDEAGMVVHVKILSFAETRSSTCRELMLLDAFKITFKAVGNLDVSYVLLDGRT